MRGSTSKQANGTWSAAFDRGPNPATGARRQKFRRGFATQGAAEAWLNDQLPAAQRGTHLDPSAMPLGDYLDAWLASKELVLKASTLTSYGAWLGRVKEQLGAVPLARVDVIMLDRFFGDLARNGKKQRKAGGEGGPLAAISVRHCQKALGKALDDAVRKRLLPFNPARDVEKPRPERAPLKLWAPPQVGAFLRATADDRLAALWVLYATTGCRRGEVLALRWSDLQLPSSGQGRLRVERSAVAAGYRVVTSSPKTAASVRSIDLDAATTAAMRRHRARQAEERLAAMGAWTGDLVFCREDGSPIHPQTATYWFQKAAAAAGLPVIPLHGLRHSYATAALEAGIPAKLVQERLGHSSIRVTLDTYTHPSDEMARKAAEDVAALLFGGSGAGSGGVS